MSLSMLSLYGMQTSEADDIFNTFFGNGRLQTNINQQQNSHEASSVQAFDYRSLSETEAASVHKTRQDETQESVVYPEIYGTSSLRADMQRRMQENRNHAEMVTVVVPIIERVLIAGLEPVINHMNKVEDKINNLQDRMNMVTVLAQLDILNQRIEVLEQKEEQWAVQFAAQEERIEKVKIELESVSRIARGY